MTDTQNWEAIYEFLQPKSSPYWVEQPALKQKLFLRSMHKEVLFGGAAGGGKSSALLMAALQFTDVPNYSAILFRRTFADLNLPGALMDRFRDWMAEFDDVRWNNNTYTATFPSGARVTFGYLNNVNDYLRYKGSEFQFVGMDEVTEIRQNDYTYLFSRLRRPATGPLSRVPLRMRATTNPAPNWVRQRFIVEGEKYGRLFVPSTLLDNPGIEQVSYREQLAELSPVERKRLEFGDWWATEIGSMFKREDFVIIGPEEEAFPKFDRNTQWVRYWDLASTAPNPNNKDPDWTVGVLGAFHEGRFYIMDIRRDRMDSADVEKLVQDTAVRDGPDIPVRIEQEPGSSGKSLMDQYARYVLPGFDFQGIPATGDKELRAQPLAAAVRNGNVCLLRGDWITEFLDEISSFPEGEIHDDQVDAAVHAFNFVAGLGGGLRRKVKIVV